MRSIPWLRHSAVLVACVVLGGALHGWAQYPSSPGSPLTRQDNSTEDRFNPNPIFDAKRLTALNAERHKSMVSDTEKLVRLARELDAEIASNPTGELTPEELHKVASIEKLARSVKTKMAQSFGGGPDIKPLAVPLSVPGVQ